MFESKRTLKRKIERLEVEVDELVDAPRKFERRIEELEHELKTISRDARIKEIGQDAHDELMRLKGETKALRLAIEAFSSSSLNNGFSNRGWTPTQLGSDLL